MVEGMEKEAINVSNKSGENSMTIISMNICLLVNLKHLVNDPLISKASMICLQETWHKTGSTENITVDGYNSHFNSGNEWKGNGIATFYRDGFRNESSVW